MRRHQRIERLLDAEANLARERVNRARVLFKANYNLYEEYKDALRALLISVGRSIDFKVHGTIPNDLLKN